MNVRASLVAPLIAMALSAMAASAWWRNLAEPTGFWWGLVLSACAYAWFAMLGAEERRSTGTGAGFFTEKGRIGALNGLRGVLAFLVFCAHFHTKFGTNTEGYLFTMSNAFHQAGTIRQNTFFFMSGFLIYRLLMTKSLTFWTFMKRRVVRLYPTFLVVMGLYIVLAFAVNSSKLPQGPLPRAVYILENLAMMPGVINVEPLISPAWTLSFEMAFYLSIPILIRALALKRRSRRQRLVLWFVLLIVEYAALSPKVLPFVFFTLGIILYEVMIEPMKTSPITEMASILLLAGALLIRVLYLWTPHILVGAGVFAVVMHIMHEGVLKRILSLQPLQYMGEMSYSFFLTHGLSLHLVTRILGTGPFGWAKYSLAFAICVVLSQAVGRVTYRYIEYPLSLSGWPLGLLAWRKRG